MLVSNFEVAWLDSAEGRRDETRYELQVTNLYERSLAFQVRCHATPPEGLFFGKEARLALSGGWLRYDELAPGPDSGSASQWIAQIEPGESSTFRLLKRFRGWDAIRGTVDLLVPALRPWVTEGKTTVPHEYGLPEAQTEDPVPVLLHARRIDIHEEQTRQDEYRNRGHVGGGYSSEAVALASGKALVELRPSSPYVMTAEEIRDQSSWTTAGSREAGSPSGEVGGAGSEAAPGQTGGRLDGALALPPEQRPMALVDLLASLGDDPAAARAVNVILDDLGVPVRLQHQLDQSGGD